MTEPCIRPLTLSDLQELLLWAKAEGWNPGLADAECFHAADPQGFFGCFVKNRLAAAISAVRYGEDFGFIGLYICHPDFRGRGLGKRVWDHAMHYLEGRSIGLDGVPAQQQNYARMGFKPHYRTWRWTGRLIACASLSPQIAPPDADNLAAIRHLDQRAFGYERQAFLHQWLGPSHHTFYYTDGQKLSGYGTTRQCHEGFKIGPLFADNDEIAASLLAALAAKAAGQDIIIDVPESRTGFSRHLEAQGFTRNFMTARMYRGTPPRLEERLVFGVTSLELG